MSHPNIFLSPLLTLVLPSQAQLNPHLPRGTRIVKPQTTVVFLEAIPTADQLLCVGHCTSTANPIAALYSQTINESDKQCPHFIGEKTTAWGVLETCPQIT